MVRVDRTGVDHQVGGVANGLQQGALANDGFGQCGGLEGVTAAIALEAVNEYIVRRVQEEDLGVLVELAQFTLDPEPVIGLHAAGAPDDEGHPGVFARSADREFADARDQLDRHVVDDEPANVL